MSKEIDLKEVTDRQMLELKKALLDYQFIMDHIKDYGNMKGDDKKDFEQVYYKFYLSARWAVYGNKEKRDKYFKVFKKQKDITDLNKIVIALHNELKNDEPKKECKLSKEEGYDFSVATKMLHTHHPEYPIFDSKVQKYLDGLAKSKEERFYWNRELKGVSKTDQIKHDWEKLNSWYAAFEASDEGKRWIEWFDKEFPEHAKISNIKKIDFIIFAFT